MMAGSHRILASLFRDSILRGVVSRRSRFPGPVVSSQFREGRIGFSSLGRPVCESLDYQRMIEDTKKAYGSNPEVDAAMDEMLSSQRLILFMEGSFDHPKSLCAGNLSKIFTSLQIIGLSTVDLLQHPVILGYLCTHMNENVRNILFKDGRPFLDYDQILELFKKGTLLQALEVSPKADCGSSHKEFRGLLPIANY